jgi:hypothetical protein
MWAGILPADVREAKEIECLRFAFPSLFPVPFGKPPELDQARFVWMEFQPKLAQPFLKTLQKTLCVCLMLESQDCIVRIANHHHLASRKLLAPDVHPEIEDTMKIDIGEDR